MRKLLMISGLVVGSWIPLASFAWTDSSTYYETERVYEPALIQYEPAPVVHEYREYHGPYFGSPVVRHEYHYDTDSRPRLVHEEHVFHHDDDDD